MSNGLEELKELYPVFEFQNKTNVTQELILADNNSVEIVAGGKLKIASKDCIQLPSTKTFKFIQPTLDDLKMVGLIQVKTVAKATPNNEA